MSASAVLRSETLELHHHLESQIDWAAELGDFVAYRSLLQRMWSVVAPADAVIHNHCGDAPELAGRRTAAWILDDLSYLQRCVSLVDDCLVNNSGLQDECEADFSWACDAASAAGVAYVLEGSSLGGLLLAAIVEKQLGIVPTEGATFLVGYGKDAMQRWRRTRGWLDRILIEPGEVDRAVAAAARTFQQYGTALGVDE